MPTTRSQISLPILLITIILFTTVTYLYQTRQNNHMSTATMATEDKTLLSNLAVSLRQTAKSPPTLAIKVTNNNPKSVTILTWDSPLDPLALQLGLLSITPPGAKEALDIPTIKVSRKMPPEDDSLVSLEPGASSENEVVLKEMIVPPEQLQGGKASVRAHGRWTRVWPMRRADLGKEAIETMGAQEGAVAGEYETESVEIEV